MSTVEQQQEVDNTIANSDVVSKYTKAASITNRALEVLIEASKDGAKIIDLCKLGDDFITTELKAVYSKGKIPKGLAFPTAISVNQIVCHFSPIENDPEADATLKSGDVAKISLGAQIDGFGAVVSHTLVVDASEANPVTGPKADVITAAHVASEAALRLLQPGHTNLEVTETVDKVAEAYGVSPVEGMLSHQQEKDVVDGEKHIMLSPNEQHRKDYKKIDFEVGEVWAIDILMSTGQGKAKASELRTTIYKKTDGIYHLKMKASRAVYSEITTKFGKFPFTIRALEDDKRGRFAIQECSTHGVVLPYPIYTEKEGDYVAQFQYTALITANGPVRITTPPHNNQVIQSEKKIEDEALANLLSQSVSGKKKKRNKKRSGKSAEDKEE